MRSTKKINRNLSLIILAIIVSASFPLLVLYKSAAGDAGCWWENWYRDNNRNKIDDLIEQQIQATTFSTLSTTHDYLSFSVFIHYNHHPNSNDVHFLRKMGLEVSYVANFLNIICVRNVTSRILYSLTDLPSVVMVELQPRICPRLDVSVKAVKARGSQLYSPNTAWELGYTGNNVVVAVLDTGVDDEHEFLQGKFVAGFDCSGPSAATDRETNPDDMDGHGTHVASIIMGNGGDEGIYMGVAPNAKLVDVKVISERGVNLGDQLIRGIEWVIANKERYNIKVINLSLGSDVEDQDGTSAISQAANKAVQNGIVVVAAAGNNGPEPQTLTAPAIADHVICVTALNDLDTITRTDDFIAYYSSRGPRGDGAKKPDVCAPGSNIIGARASRTGRATDSVVSMSGTSMAAPHVAGLAALILEANPDLSPLQVKQVILGTAEDKGIEGWDPDYGWGEIDAYEAILAVLTINQVNQPPIISATANKLEVYRVIESFILKASIVDDRTPSENLTVRMFINDSLGDPIEVQMEYENDAELWIGVYTPNASAPLGNYSAYISAFDDEGAERKSEITHFTVMNNPPSITSVNVRLKAIRNQILTVTIEAFDYESLANASICLYNGEQWLNFTKPFQENSCTFEVDLSNFTGTSLKLLVKASDKDHAEASLYYGEIFSPYNIPTLMFVLISLAGAAATVLLVFLFHVKRSNG